MKAFPTFNIISQFSCNRFWLIRKFFSHAPFFLLLIKITIIFIPRVTWTISIMGFIIIILFDSIWFNTGRCLNNTLYFWYITADRIYFTRFNCIYITPRTLFCTNANHLWCNTTCYKTKDLGARKWIFLMPQMTVTLSDVFAFPEKCVSTKWTNFYHLYSVQDKSLVTAILSEDNPWNNVLIQLSICFLWSLSKLYFEYLRMWGITHNIHPFTANLVLMLNCLFWHKQPTKELRISKIS